MTDDDRFSLVVSVVGENPVIPLARDVRIPMGTLMSAGYTPGVPRLGVPALLMRDASLGVTNPGFREGDMATALPASIVLDSSFNPVLARASGRMIALEARSRGFNVQLAGGINLARDPRNGRNFEHLSEDPLLSAVLAAESINGIQGEGVISTIKHYSLNCNETNRHWLDAIIDPAAHRESDLLAFEIAIERSQPGSVMTGYNKINGDYAGGNAVLLEDVLKGAWAYPGWVMSDWGATLSWEFALKGLDQESGLQIDKINWHAQPFVEPLKEAYAQGKLSKERLSDMVRRILRSMFAVGIDAWGPLPEVDMVAHNEIALKTARQGIVLLKNDGVLPLSRRDYRSHRGDWWSCPGRRAGRHRLECGRPSRRVRGRNQDRRPRDRGARPESLSPSVIALRRIEETPPRCAGRVRPGDEPGGVGAAGAAFGRGHRVRDSCGGESFDLLDLSLPWGLGRGNRRCCGREPEHDRAAGDRQPGGHVLAGPRQGHHRSWYPGQAGGQAIAEILTGA